MEDNEKIYLRKDGRYSTKYKKGIKEDGSSDYGYIYGKTEDEVINKKKEILENMIMIDKSLFSGDIYSWLKSAKISCKKSTYSNYEYTAYAYLIPSFGKYKKKQINKDIINDFTEKLLNRGLEAKTVKDILIILQQVLKYVNVKIDIVMPKVKKKEIQILTREHQKKVEEKVINELTRDSLGIYLCLYTGLRIGELCGLKCKNIDLEKKVIKVEKTLIRVKNQDKNIKTKTVVILDEPKSTSSIREIPIPEFIIPMLELFDADAACFLLTGTTHFIEPRSYTNHYKKIMESLEINNYNFHALRHTFATRCIEGGCDPKTLSEILGHSSVKITLERYVHPNFDTKVNMMNTLSPLCCFAI